MTYSCPFSIEELAYDEAVRIAHDTGKISGDAGPLLETVVDMLDELERPDSHFDCIQIAGTNGKTSTSRFAASILGGEGLKCALYTSPELVHMEERMEIFGACAVCPRRLRGSRGGPPRQPSSRGGRRGPLYHHAL